MKDWGKKEEVEGLNILQNNRGINYKMDFFMNKETQEVFQVQK